MSKIFVQPNKQSRTQSLQNKIGQRLLARRDRGISGYNDASCYKAVNQNIFFFSNSPSSPGHQPLAKEPEDSGYEIAPQSTQSHEQAT